MKPKSPSFTNINRIERGMVVRNYKELCRLLGEDERIANSKAAQLKRWKEYFDFNRDGHRFIIGDVHPPDAPSDTSYLDSHNPKFTLCGERLLTALLVNCPNECIERISNTRLYFLLGLCSFTTSNLYNAAEVDKLNEIDEQDEDDKPVQDDPTNPPYHNVMFEGICDIVSSQIYEDVIEPKRIMDADTYFVYNARLIDYDCFFDYYFQIISAKLSSILKSVNNRGVVFCERNLYLVDLSEGYPIIRIATEDERQEIALTEKNVANELDCYSKFDVWQKDKKYEFNNKVSEQLYDKYEWERYYSAYQIRLNPEYDKPPAMQEVSLADTIKCIGDLLVSAVSKRAEKRYLSVVNRPKETKGLEQALQTFNEGFVLTQRAIAKYLIPLNEEDTQRVIYSINNGYYIE